MHPLFPIRRWILAAQTGSGMSTIKCGSVMTARLAIMAIIIMAGITIIREQLYTTIVLLKQLKLKAHQARALHTAISRQTQALILQPTIVLLIKVLLLVQAKKTKVLQKEAQGLEADRKVMEDNASILKGKGEQI